MRPVVGVGVVAIIIVVFRRRGGGSIRACGRGAQA